MSVKAIGLMLMSTMKQAMVSLFTGDGSLSLSLSPHYIDHQTNLEREKRKEKKPYFKQCIWTFFFEKRTIFFFLSEVYLVKVDKTIEK